MPKLTAFVAILLSLIYIGSSDKGSVGNPQCQEEESLQSFDNKPKETCEHESLKNQLLNKFIKPERSSGKQPEETFLPLKDIEMERLMAIVRNSSSRPPIFLVPGLGATRLTAWKQKACRYTTINVKDNVWLNAGKLLETLSIDPHCWLDCLKLGPNQTDPEGCKVRPEEGINAVSVLSPGPIIGGATAVYSWLIDYLAENMGYDSNSILAFPYDWRLSPNKMEERDGFFTKFKYRVEEAVERLGRPGIFIGHSMANLLLLYFLEWLKSLSPAKRGGRSYEDWVSDHIWMQVGLGAPLLGASDPLKSVISGEDMGLKITDEQARLLEASFGSTNFLNPRSTKRNSTKIPSHQPWVGADWPEDIVTILSDKGAGATLQFDVNAIGNGELFRWIGNIFDDTWLTEKYHSLHQDFFKQRFFNNLEPPARPPIKHIIMAYGVNLRTSMGLIYLNKRDQNLPILDELVIEQDGKLWAEKYRKTTGKSDRRFLRNSSFPKSGDGTVPYISLSWAHSWIFEENYEVKQHPERIISASKSHFLQWAPEKISEVVARSTLVPGFEVHNSTDIATGRTTLVLEIEGLEHKDNTKDIFTMTTIFEYILPKVRQEMCLESNPLNVEICTYGYRIKRSPKSTKMKDNMLTSMFKDFQSKIFQYDDFFRRNRVFDDND